MFRYKRRYLVVSGTKIQKVRNANVNAVAKCCPSTPSEIPDEKLKH